MALNSAQTKAIAYIDEIHSLSRSNRFTLMLSKINNLYIFLYSNKSILYSNINRYFYKIGLVPILTNYCHYISHETMKDVLRLLHIFIKTNKNIQEAVGQSEKFVKYLSAILCTESAWNNIGTFRYHIHIAAYLLLDQTCWQHFDIATIRTIIRGKIHEDIHSENNFLHTVCYACTMPITSSAASGNTSLTSVTDEDLFSLSAMGGFSPLINSYFEEFKTFYKNSENTTNEYSLFLLDTEYAFDQICHSISYYSRLSERIYANIFNSDIYESISGILAIRNIPEHFISRSLHILSIPSIYSHPDERIRKETNQISYALTSYFDNDSLPSDNQDSGKVLPNKYWSYESGSLYDTDDFSMKGKHTLLSIESENNLKSKSIGEKSTVKMSLTVDEWLIKNRLYYLRAPFDQLSEKGLYQMKTLITTPDNRIRLIELLTTKLDLDIIGTLEFLECLDRLTFN